MSLLMVSTSGNDKVGKMKDEGQQETGGFEGEEDFE